jgi:hypothetical protein
MESIDQPIIVLLYPTILIEDRNKKAPFGAFILSIFFGGDAGNRPHIQSTFQ